MNIIPLYEYVSRQLNSNISLYDSQSRALAKRIVCNDAAPDFPELYPDIKSRLLGHVSVDYPMFTFLNDYICYAHFAFDNTVLITGPFHIQFSGSLMYSQHKLTVKSIKEQEFAAVPSVHPAFVMRDILLLFNCHRTVPLSEQECSAHNFSGEHILEEAQQKTTAILFSNRENQQEHNPYTQEVRLQKAIEDGDLETLQKIWNEPASGNLGTLAKDPVRNGKNLCIYNVISSGRAAIRAGIPAEYIFSLTDSYCQQIEELKDLLLLKSLVENAQIHFAQLVSDFKKEAPEKSQKEPVLISRCKDYIFKHLHSPLTIQDVAYALNVHPGYLGSLFKETEKMPLHQYIMQQKIELTKNLLTFSDYSYLEIAHYLGFVSQSHLGARFKTATGMTLKQYRDAYRKDVFYQ